MEPQHIRDARRRLKQVREERAKSWNAAAPRTLDEEIKRQDEISRRFIIEQECLRVLEPYNEARRIKYRERGRGRGRARSFQE